jgi:hypothetical protein
MLSSISFSTHYLVIILDVVEMLTLLPHIQEVMGSNLGLETA